MFNGEVDHVESPSRDDSHQESETTTPSKEIAEVEDFKPSADEPGDPQVCTLNRLSDLVHLHMLAVNFNSRASPQC